MTIATQGVGYGIEPLYRTQKAKGIKALHDCKFLVPDFTVYEIEQFMDSQTTGFGKLSPDVLVGRFVRPCPMVPRHGFVDSRPIVSTKEAEKIIAETYATEKEAELVSMPVINAEYSAIFTNGKLIVGPNNDGATAGIGSRIIPAIGLPVIKQYYWEKALERAGITETPFVELLWNKAGSDGDYKCLFVQLRNGPSVPDSKDFIPAETIVKKIITCIPKEINGKPGVVDQNGEIVDLVKWETDVKSFEPGTVVYFPGGTLAAHIGIHCYIAYTDRQQVIPVITSYLPKIGEVLKQQTEVSKQDINKIRAGFVLGCNAQLNYRTATYAMLAGCHSIVKWSGKQDVLLGFALGCCYRLLITAGLGEYRHSPSKREQKRKPHRDAVYSRCWNKILASSTRAKYCKSIDSFANESWGGSYGGKNWLRLTGYAGLIYNNLLDGNIPMALDNLNKAVNCSHNGGWGFNKFVSESTLNEAAQSPAVMLLKCAPELYKAILADESNPKLAVWFAKKKHYDMSELDDIESKTYNSEDSEENCDCGECSCESCNPDGDCGNDDCDYCHHKEDSGPIVCAQAKIVENSSDSVTVHIQYKQQTMQKYFTKDIVITGHILNDLKSILVHLHPPKSESFSGSKVPYYRLRHSGNLKYWVLGSLGVNGFYLSLVAE